MWSLGKKETCDHFMNISYSNNEWTNQIYVWRLTNMDAINY